MCIVIVKTIIGW